MKICKEVLGQLEVEGTFAPAVLSFESGDDLHSQTSFELESNSAELCHGLISALGWLPYSQAEKHIGRLLSASSPVSRHVGIAASAIHRKDPEQSLIDALMDDDLRVRARALKAVGEWGRTDRYQLFNEV